MGTTANQACCVCGGGETSSCEPQSNESPIEMPTIIISLAPSSSEGSMNISSPSEAPIPKSNTPSSIPTKLPSNLPTEAPVINPSSVPTELLSNLPTESPIQTTHSPSSSQLSECRNFPDYWHDSDGSFYDCDWYASSKRCELYGQLYANFGKTANQACCDCGGGSIPVIPCENVEGWHDSDGTQFNCEWYSKLRRCEKYGDKYENHGYTANQACCQCKE